MYARDFCGTLEGCCCCKIRSDLSSLADCEYRAAVSVMEAVGDLRDRTVDFREYIITSRNIRIGALRRSMIITLKFLKKNY